MPRQLFSFTKLQEYVRENKIILDNSDYSKITRNSIINGKCKNCEDTFSKNFRSLIKQGGPYCSFCTEINRKEKLGYINFDNKSLLNFCQKNNIQLVNTYEQVNRDSQIIGKCNTKNCSNTFNKTFVSLIKHGGPYCIDCIKINGNIKRVSTCQDKIGCDNVFQSQDIKNQIKNTLMNTYGVCFSASIPEVIERKKRNLLIKTGYDNCFKNPVVREKMKQTYFNKTGYEYPFKNPVIREKIRKTMIQRYGVEHASQNIKIQEKIIKNSYKFYKYVFPSGNTIRLQGYEKFGIDYLLNIKKYKEHQIITCRSKVPELWWKDSNKQRHRHFVDIFIPHKNKCIEIKSTWTIRLNTKNIIKKMKYAIKSGYEYEIWVFDKGGKLQFRIIQDKT